MKHSWPVAPTSMPRWLSYDKDLEKLVARPAMRNFHCEATRDAAEHIEAVMDVDTHDLDLFDEKLCEAEQAFAYAEMCAGNMALCGLDARQRKLAKRAQDALSLMLDTQATQSEIAGALHVVESSLKALVPDVAPEVHNEMRRQIADRVRVPLQIESPAVVAASLAEGTIPQRVYIETRITRAGEASIHHLTELARSMSLHGGGTHQDASNLRDIIDDLRQTWSMLSDIARDPEVPEVARHAAGSRLTTINEALTTAGQINATLTEKVTV